MSPLIALKSTVTTIRVALDKIISCYANDNWVFNRYGGIEEKSKVNTMIK
jgi:nitrate reductase alpha subunit